MKNLNDSPTTQEEGESTLSIVVRRLTPRLLIGLLSFAILMLAAVIEFSVLTGGTESLNAWKFSSPKDKDVELNKAEEEVLDLRWQLADKERQIATLLNKPSRKPVACNEEVEGFHSTLNKLFLLEKTIPSFGKFISTHVEPDADRKKSYLLIQTILMELGYFNGKPDGNQQRTQAAVVRFQQAFNASLQVLGPEYRAQKIEQFGNVGYKTLEAMRSTYRRQLKNT